MHVTETVASPQWNEVRQCLQHVTEAFGPDPQTVTAQSVQGSEIAPLADQPQMPTIEFARTVRFQRPGAFAAPIALPAPQPRPASDPTRHCFDEVAKPRRTQTARQPAMIPPLNHAKVPADHALGPVAVALAGCIRHHDIAVARGTERGVEPCDLLLQAAPFGVRRHRREKGHDGTQPRNGDTQLVDGLNVAGAGAALIRLHPGDAIERNFLERRRAIEAGWSHCALAAGSFRLTRKCHMPSSGMPDEERQAILRCNVSSGVPEASTLCQFTTPSAAPSC